MHWKGWLTAGMMFLLASLGWTQGNVQITISYTNPANTEYQMTLQNNNTGWWVDQVHVLYTTPGVLQATNIPSNWSVNPDVPWDAIPYNLRFQPNAPAHRIASGQSLTVGFKMNTPTPVEDFYIQFRSVNASNQTKEYAYRIKVVQPVDTPKDSPVAASVQTPAAGASGPGPGGDPILYFDYFFFVPTLQYRIETFDANSVLRDRVFYPEIPDPPHLEHYFTGNVVREVNANGAVQNELWTIDASGAQWCGGGTGFNELYWLYGSNQFRRPMVRWQFTPSVRRDDGSRVINLTLYNPSNTPVDGQFWMYTEGNRSLDSAGLRRWRQQFQPNVQQRIDIGARQSTTIQFTLRSTTPATRFFYGEFELNQRGVPSTRIYFSHMEADAPVLIGYMGADGANRPVQVVIQNPNTSTSRTKPLSGDSQGVWRVRLETGDEPLIGDAGFYTPVWQVRVKPQGALSHTFTNVLLPGGDTIDPYLRMTLVLGDVNGDDCIDDADLLLVLFAFGGSGGAADLNLDGIVDDADLLIVLFNFGQGC